MLTTLPAPPHEKQAVEIVLYHYHRKWNMKII